VGVNLVVKGTFLEEIGALFPGTKIHLIEFWRYIFEFWRHIFEFWCQLFEFWCLNLKNLSFEGWLGGWVGPPGPGGTFQLRCGQKKLCHPLDKGAAKCGAAKYWAAKCVEASTLSPRLETLNPTSQTTNSQSQTTGSCNREADSASAAKCVDYPKP